jgi:hypothetical protein
MDKSANTPTLKRLRLKPLREEDMVSRVGPSTGGVQGRRRRRTPPPQSRGKTKRGLQEDAMKKSQERSPVLYVLLMMALVVNSTASLTLLLNRSKLVNPPTMAEIEPQTVSNRGENTEPVRAEKKAETVAAVLSRAETISERPAAKAQARRVIASNETKAPGPTPRAREEDKITLLPNAVPYLVIKSTTLVTREHSQRIFLPKGTKIHVAGLTQGGKALVVSRNGNPDGFVPGWAIEEIKNEEGKPPSPMAYGTPESSGNSNLPGSLPTPRVSAGPYGGSIGLGPAYIYVGRDGQVSGSFSR